VEFNPQRKVKPKTNTFNLRITIWAPDVKGKKVKLSLYLTY
jgi:hypothetical protein